MNTTNEYDQIRNMLGKIRLIKEEVQPNNPAEIDMDTTDQTEEETTSKGGEKITFDDINTIGFIASQNELSDDVKNSIKMSVGEFIKATGLILDTITITVDDGQIVLSTETIKNPGMESVKSIIFDTDNDSPKIEFVSGALELNNDVITLLQTATKTFNDNQIGRDKLITSTQGGGNATEEPQ